MNYIPKKRKETEQNKIIVLISSICLHFLKQYKPHRWPQFGGFSVINPLTPFLLLVAFASSADQEQIRKEFETMAAEMPYVDTPSILYDRQNSIVARFRPDDEAVFRRIIKNLQDSRYTKESTINLLNHSEPKVRTLAVIDLFEREDPNVLPALFSMITDSSLTYDNPGDTKSAGGLGSPEPQTVGQIAIQLLGFYMYRAHNVVGRWGGVSEYYTELITKNFPQYWATRNERKYCAGWFAVQLARACQGTFPTPDRLKNIREVRDRINRLPANDRAWTLLALRREIGAESLVTEYELLEFCRQIGPDELMRVLHRDMPSSDPDLEPGRNSYGYFVNIHSFILQHAADLLRPQDVSALRECERQEREFQQKHGITGPNILMSVWWTVARASLMEKSKAVEELRKAYDHFQGEYDSHWRIVLSSALLKIGGESEIQFLKDWFYSEKPMENGLGGGLGSEGLAYSRAQYIFNVPQRERSKQLKMIAAIIEDDRFESLDVTTLIKIFLVLQMNAEYQTKSTKEVQQWKEYLEGYNRERQLYRHDPAFRESKLKLWQDRLRRIFQKNPVQD